MQELSDLQIPFPWADRRPALLNKCLYLPSYWPGAHLGPAIWQEDGLFGNPLQPLAVEFCSGNGQWIADAAMAFNHLNWVAVEKDFYRAKKTWLKIFRYSIPNLFVVCGEALEFSKNYLETGSVAQAWVNFPDPWPKRHHAKHRLVQSPFAEEMQRVLSKKAPLTLVTDDARYSEQMIRVFASWKSAFASERFTTELPGYGTSYFHSLWLQKKCTIRYHRFFYE